jgi:hypothetical protein
MAIRLENNTPGATARGTRVTRNREYAVLVTRGTRVTATLALGRCA